MIHAKKLILHIGSWKTGTTSIQRYLNDVYPRLKADKVLYPKASRLLSDGSLDLAHHQLSRALDETDGVMTQKLDGVLQGIAKEMRQGQCETLMLSSEVFMGMRRPETMPLFFQADEVQIVAVFRNQAEFLSSMYYTDVCHRKVIEWPMGYLGGFNGNLLDYASVLAPWRRAWPHAQFSVSLFEKGTPTRDFPVANFIQQIELGWSLTQQDNVIEHRSLPAQGTLFLRQLAASGWNKIAFFDIFQACHRNPSWFAPIFEHFSPDVMQRILADHAVQNKALAEQFLSQGPMEFSPLNLPDEETWNAAMGDPAAVFPSVLKHITRQAAQNILTEKSAPSKGKNSQ